jgi:hypothetical protein
MMILAPVAAGAQEAAQATPAAQTEQKPVKTPPPPLFPRHSRGLYRNAQGIEVIDATPQSPPLETDDPGVPDKGQYEINFTTRFDHSTDANRLDLMLVDANYGILPVNRDVNQLEKRRRNLFDDVHFTALRNRFVIQLNDSLFDSRALGVKADWIVVVEERIPDLEKACRQQVR